MRKIRMIGAVLALAVLNLLAAENAEKPLLIQKPALSHGKIAFSFAGDLWTVGSGGGEATRLTTDIGTETNPFFSPDGTMIAFTGEYDGNVDVFVIPAAGGSPRRLTSHPRPDLALGWTPDGKRVLFSSTRNSFSRRPALFTVSVEGGFPDELPLPTGSQGAFAPDGQSIAYVPFTHFQRAWKRYRGGQTMRIWLARLSDSEITEVPRENWNDFNPMWLGNTLYFLSDRNGAVSLFRYQPGSTAAEQALANNGFDIKSASAGDGLIIYEQFGSVHLFDPQSGNSREVHVTIHADMPHLRPGFKNLDPKRIQNLSISPAGMRLAFETRGEIFTAPAEKGDLRDISNTPGVMERDPAWSPDGKSIAYFSDADGEYTLYISDRNGTNQARKVSLGTPSFFYSPVWSPDSKKIAFHNKRFEVWYVDLEKGVPVKVGEDSYDGNDRDFDPAWSPDSKYLAFALQLKNYFRALFIHSLESGKTTQITDGMSDARFASWDASGKYLYFTASTDIGPTAGGISLSSLFRPVTRSVYLCVLDKTLPSPLSPEQDDEKDEEKNDDKKAEKKADKEKETASPTEKDSAKDSSDESKDAKPEPKKKVVVKLDFEGIQQRILALPLPAANYTGISAGKEGVLFLNEAPVVITDFEEEPKMTVHRFDLSKRKAEKFLEGVRRTGLSANSEKLWYQKGDQFFITSSDKADGKPVKLEGLSAFVDPIAEWRQMYHEVWRIQRDFLYDPNFHGLDLKAAEAKYRPFLEGAASRSDVNYIFEDMLGELTLGHVYVGGGDTPQARKVKGGLLGADYKIENGRYRFARIYSGESWNPDITAPLTQPGVNVQPGDYLLAVRGRELKATDDIYTFFEETAGKSILLKVGPNADGSKARYVTVVPVEDDYSLRRLAWIEDNRRTVSRLSNGRLAYVYLPDTAVQGYRYFSRYFFAQTDKEGAVVDERYNAGGLLADYIIDHLKRNVMSYVTTREHADYHEPAGVIQGPKAMIINESAGSGGDAMPWYFRRAGVGKLIGTRTWGGLVGIGDYPPLMDGGTVTAPRMAIYGLNGDWEVENVGIAPDIEVTLDPKLWRQGHDAQLEKAVEVLMKELEEHPIPAPRKPKYPNYHAKDRVRASK